MKEQCIRAAIIGITGYTGIELTRLITQHPIITLTVATSRKQYGKKLNEIHSFLTGLPQAELILSSYDPLSIAKNCDVVFLAVPHSSAMSLATELLQYSVKVIDLSADFRLKNPETYASWYTATHIAPELLSEAIYGLPELNEQRIKNARLVANPGCYSTSVILGLYAALINDLIYLDDIIIDTKSGTSGAGRNLSNSSLLFCEVYDSFKAYGFSTHRHTPEIEQELSRIVGKPIVISFNPHLLPINRGILSTIYTRLKKNLSQEELQELYTDTWKEHPWIRVLPLGKLPETRNTRNSMFCDIGLIVDPRTQRFIITSAIDNICRGASGQAIANANIMFGLPMTTGLMSCPTIP